MIMDCKKAYKLICENLDENFDSPTCVEIKKHLDHCPNCKNYLNSLKTTIKLYRIQKIPKLNKTLRRKILTIISGKNTSKS